MKRFLKRFIKLSWTGIPIGIIVIILIGTTVLAVPAYYAIRTQPITQEIEGKTVVYDYGSIEASFINLSSVEVDTPFNYTYTNAVTVDLGPDGEGKALKMVCNADEKYASFDVTITLKTRPEGSTVGLYGYGISVGGEVAIDLDVAGLYTFDQTISGVAGSSTGSASSTITFTLEDSTTPL